MTTKTTTTTCRRCGRGLTDPKRVTLGIGRWCAKREAAEKIIAKYPTAQVDKAIELIGDSGIVRVSAGIFSVVSSSGIERYTTTSVSCTCKAGVYGRTCYHRVAAELIAA